MIYSPLHQRSRTIAELLSQIETALENDGGWCIEPGSIDTHGLTIVADGVSYRLELTDEERLYPSQADYEPRLDARLEGLAHEPSADRDWMADTDNDMPF